MTDLNQNNRRLLRKIAKLTPERKEDLITILDKVFSGEPITDPERKENPKLWEQAEQFFTFGKKICMD